MRRRGRLQQWWVKLALGLAFANVLLLLAEVGLRLVGVQPAYQPEALGQWRLAPNQHAAETRGPRDGHNFHISTNADGLRTEVPRQRSAGRTRVAVLGDSTVFGWGVDDGGSIADGMRQALGADRVEVINAGQPGYSTTQAAWLFGEAVAAYQPDLSVFFVPLHDFNLVLVSDREVLEGGRSPQARLRVALARHSAIYQKLRTLVFAATEKPFILPQEQTKEPRVPRVSDAERARALLDAQAEAASWGGRIAIGMLPFQKDIEGPFDRQPRPGEAWIRSFAGEHDMAVVDVRSCCRGADLVLPDDPGHLTAAGNLQVGQAIGAVVGPLLEPAPGGPGR